jgi:oxygen-independent coproporphyrinogen-3 oxidase
MEQPRPLRDLWRHESQESLFLYLHVPFCEFRCGFCNLFTIANPAADWTRRYVDQIRREAEQVREALPDARFARLAIGGGTPTFLAVDQLADLLKVATDVMGAVPKQIPVSIEASPSTVTDEKLSLLREFGIDRLSLGVQTFDEPSSHAMGRPQKTRDVTRTIESVRAFGFPVLNLDLIYGGEGQTIDAWLDSVRKAIEYQPEELYLYPLYVRALTGLGCKQHSWPDERLLMYRKARELLSSSGYEQVSLRMFRTSQTSHDDGPVYCCQSDGMIGLGPGARSYSSALHYSTEYAVGRSGVASILSDYLTRQVSEFSSARYGFLLDDEERQRRYLILSLLQVTGLDRSDYITRFGRDVLDDFPQLRELISSGLAVEGEYLRLTTAGLEWSDAIGPWLYSSRVQQLMESYTWH